MWSTWSWVTRASGVRRFRASPGRLLQQHTDRPADIGAPTRNEPVTLTLATFNEFGYDDLLAEYMKQNPNVIDRRRTRPPPRTRPATNYTTKLAAGSGLSDIEAIEVDWLPEVMQNADKLIDLTVRRRRGPLARLEGRSRPPRPTASWSATAPTSAPRASATASDLFEKAGLPTDRAEVAALLGSHLGRLLRPRQAVRREVRRRRGSTPPTRSSRAMVNQLQNAFSSSEPRRP